LGRNEETNPEIRVVLVGVGAIGSEISRFILKRRGVRIVGAIDPNKAGMDLGEVIGLGKSLGIKILKSIDELKAEAEIAIHATTSFLDKAYPQIADLIKRGLNVISTCEELSYPYIVSEEISKRLDEMAKKHRVAILGTGVNPGFLMDTLIITLTAMCQDIERISAERVIDAAKRRLPFQVKIGAGLSIKDFSEKIVRGEITGHIGLKQSIAMVVDSLGLRLDKIVEEPVEPVIADKEMKSNFITVKPGSVAGLIQKAHGVINGKNFITLTFKAYMGVSEEYDSIIIEGTPTIKEKISPCIHGDIATAAIIVNMIPKVLNAKPGLKTMKDMQVPSAIIGDARAFVKSRRYISANLK
jgi:4-hydroxy-tetrahydrodipicolinate reductase